MPDVQSLIKPFIIGHEGRCKYRTLYHLLPEGYYRWVVAYSTNRLSLRSTEGAKESGME